MYMCGYAGCVRIAYCFLFSFVFVQAKERLHRAARESEARRIVRMQQAQAGKAQGGGGGRKNNQQGPVGAGPGGNMGSMRGPNGEMLQMPPSMMGSMMGDGLGGVGPGMAGNKRSRAERDAMRAAAAGNMQNMTPAQQQQYAMQLAGMDEAQRKNMMGMHMQNPYMAMNQAGNQGPPKKVFIDP